MDSSLEMKLDAPLVFEYMQLGIADLSIPFVYRFKGPFATAWVADRVTLPWSMSQAGDWRVKFALKKWAEILDANATLDDRGWMAAKLKRTTVRVVECEAVPLGWPAE